MASAAGVVVSQKYSQVNYNQGTAYAGFNYNSVYYPFILQFKTPSFTGKATSLDFYLSMSDGKRNNARSSKVTLRYAILASDANYSKYYTTKAVEDENQLASGTITVSGLTSDYQSKNLNIAVAGLAADTTYYLILWGDNSGGYSRDYATVNTPTNHSVTVGYTPDHILRVHHVLIDVGGGLTIFKTTQTTVPHESSYIPVTIDLPAENVSNTQAGSNYQYWTNGYGTFIGGGHTGITPISVTQDLVVEIYYPLQTYTLDIAQGNGTVITVEQDGTILKNGVDISYGAVLRITFDTLAGFKLTSHTVNGASFASGGSHTVSGHVIIAATATSALSACYIGGIPYNAYIDGQAYNVYIGDADGKPVPYGTV